MATYLPSQNHPSKTNRTYRILQGKQGWTHKWRSSLDTTYRCASDVQPTKWMIGTDGERVREICAAGATWWYHNIIVCISLIRLGINPE